LVTPAAWLVLLPAVPLVCYGAATVAYTLASRPGMALAFAGYVIANAGLIWDALAAR
jgi:hypothetical protein